jgi:hypothetical protein
MEHGPPQAVRRHGEASSKATGDLRDAPNDVRVLQSRRHSTSEDQGSSDRHKVKRSILLHRPAHQKSSYLSIVISSRVVRHFGAFPLSTDPTCLGTSSSPSALAL